MERKVSHMAILGLVTSAVSSAVKRAMQNKSSSSSSSSPSKSSGTTVPRTTTSGGSKSSSSGSSMPLLGGLFSPGLGLANLGVSMMTGMLGGAKAPTSPYMEEQYMPEFPQYQPIDNSALYEQMARERAAQIRAAIQRQKTAAQADIEHLRSQYGSAISEIEAERGKLPTEFQRLRDQASNRGMINAQRIRNALAQMGLGQSGESASQQLAQGIATSQQIADANLRQQEIDAEMARQLGTMESDLATQVSRIEQQIRDAEAAGDEQAMLALREAQAQIIAEAQANAQAKAQWDMAIADRIRQAQMQAQQDAWDRGGFESAFDKWKAEQAYRQAQQLGLLDLRHQYDLDKLARQYQYDTGLARLNASLKPVSTGGGSSTPSLTQTERTRNAVADAYNAVHQALMQGVMPLQIAQNIRHQAPELMRHGVDPEEIIKYVYENAPYLRNDIHFAE